MAITKNHAPIPAGYTALISQFHLDVIPNWHQSYVSGGNKHRTTIIENVTEEIYPQWLRPGDSIGEQLVFALKYDGTNLAILKAIFQAADEDEIVRYIQSRPGGKYTRRIWFFYELLMGKKLPLDNISSGNYVDALDARYYYTIRNARQVRRQRINDNLLGNDRFCPIIRRTKTLEEFEQEDLSGRCQKLVADYPPRLLKRAMSYLYTKETKSSFEIERVKPETSKTERFVSILHAAQGEDFFNKPKLINLQNQIVDPRFRDVDYRQNQNYIGETLTFGNEKIHYVCPKPEDLPKLADGLIASHRRMKSRITSPVIHAAVVSYGFVFLHPFEDGNGRIHRFLIHNVLARRGFSPPGMIFPVSAPMAQHKAAYDNSLENFSRPLMEHVDYTLDEAGIMLVQNETADYYRYIDMTAQAEALFQFIEQTIETELTEELAFLANYDKTKTAIQEIVDMPDRKIDLFIRFCCQNNGNLSKTKKNAYFDFLTDEEIGLMEAAVRSAYGTQDNENRVADNSDEAE